MLSFGLCDQVGQSDKLLFLKVTDIDYVVNRLIERLQL
jgi:hypothetical protein